MLKSINSKFSKSFAFRNTTSSGRILLKKLYACFFVISVVFPCFHESFASESIQKHAEFADSVLVNNKVPVENIETVDFSISQVGKCFVKNGAKNGSSVGLTNFEVVTPDKVSPDAAKNEGSYESFDSQLALLLGFVFAVLIPMLSAANAQAKHNAEYNLTQKAERRQPWSFLGSS